MSSYMGIHAVMDNRFLLLGETADHGNFKITNGYYGFDTWVYKLCGDVGRALALRHYRRMCSYYVSNSWNMPCGQQDRYGDEIDCYQTFLVERFGLDRHFVESIYWNTKANTV